jgi:DNA-binding CsgD family transcriptional regulator
MGTPRRRRSGMAGRAAMRSPGRPPVARREDRQRFWEAIARGLSSEDAAVVCGVSLALGGRWFRQGGGMPSTSLAPLSGRYLSFTEREEIAILRAQGVGVRQIACRLGRDPATISRELRRNAATRGACWTIAPRPRPGTRIGVPGARSWPSWPATSTSPMMGPCGSP